MMGRELTGLVPQREVLLVQVLEGHRSMRALRRSGAGSTALTNAHIQCWPRTLGRDVVLLVWVPEWAPAVELVQATVPLLRYATHTHCTVDCCKCMAEVRMDLERWRLHHHGNHGKTTDAGSPP